MPILGFEEHQYRKKLRFVMRKPADAEGKDETTLLVQSYDSHENSPLHCRRTLDQFTYYMLEDTNKRDNTQVIFKWAAKVEEKRAKKSTKSLRLDSHPSPQQQQPPRHHEYPVLMIDQLWLWVLEDEETVITSFPNTWQSSSHYSLLGHIRQNLQKDGSRPLIESGLDLANLIIKISVDFLRRSGPMGISLQEGFQASINDIAEHQARLFDDFKKVVNTLSNNETLSQRKRAKYTNRLFQLTEETDLLSEIMDIQDELKTIKDVFQKQKECLAQFAHLFSKGNQKKLRAEKKKSKEEKKNSGTDFDVAGGSKQQSPKASKIRDAAENNLNQVNANITAVEEMAKYAEKIRTEVSNSPRARGTKASSDPRIAAQYAFEPQTETGKCLGSEVFPRRLRTKPPSRQCMASQIGDIWLLVTDKGSRSLSYSPWLPYFLYVRNCG